MKILLLENVHPTAKKQMEAAGHQVESLKTSLTPAELSDKLKEGFEVLGIRSKTDVTAEVLKKHPQLMTIGCFCIGTDQVDLSTAAQSGVPVFNAPFASNRSVAELVLGEMLVMTRKIIQKSNAAHKGIWDKSAEGCQEIRGKTLGIIGYGRIGTQLSVMCESVGMKVIFYDLLNKMPIGNARAVASIDEVLQNADFVTLHVPENETTANLIQRKQLEQMKPSAFLINASRGSVVNIPDLVWALENKKIAGAAVDVFPEEPKDNNSPFVSPLQKFDNVILTPHIGGSTSEAQELIAIDVVQKLIRYIKNGTTAEAVNFPEVDQKPMLGKKRILHIHHNKPGMLSAINQIMSRQGSNIHSQILNTKGEVGTVIITLDEEAANRVFQDLQALSGTIKTRILEE